MSDSRNGRSWRWTRRARLLGWVLAVVVALLLGLTAHWWNPYTRNLDREMERQEQAPVSQLHTTCYEDGWCGYCTPGALCDDSEDEAETPAALPEDTYST